jgi:signal transduction histidine kinase
MEAKWRASVRILAIYLWLAFTVVFALWWFRFSLENIDLLAGLQPEQSGHWTRLRRMIYWEGTSWIVLLTIGGAGLITLAQRERRRAMRIKEFFASFSHEVKTSLASLRLQAETLKDEQAQPHSPILDRLIGDTVRLQLQLENSLFLSSQENLQLYIEAIDLRALIQRMREQWPEMQVELQQRCTVNADERALRTILSNLLQNALVHGAASRVQIEARQSGAGVLAISIADNGRGFDGEGQKLGQLFHRPKSTSGSGLGLYICSLLLGKMRGSLDLSTPRGAQGFQLQMTLPGVLL